MNIKKRSVGILTDTTNIYSQDRNKIRKVTAVTTTRPSYVKPFWTDASRAKQFSSYLPQLKANNKAERFAFQYCNVPDIKIRFAKKKDKVKEKEVKEEEEEKVEEGTISYTYKNSNINNNNKQRRKHKNKKKRKKKKNPQDSASGLWFLRNGYQHSYNSADDMNPISQFTKPEKPIYKMILDANSILDDINKSAIKPSDKKESEHKFRFSKRSFEAPLHYCVNEEFLDACKDLDVSLIGRILVCPSQKNSFHFKVSWNLKGELKKTIPNSFKKGWLKHDFPESESNYIKDQIMIYEKKMNGDAIEKTCTTELNQECPKTIKAEKIRVYPNKIQTKIFTKWLNCIKETYNHLVEKWPSCENPPSKKVAREFMKSLPCCIGIPTDIIDCAMQDLLNAAQAEKSKNGKNRAYNASFKARESITQCGIVIRPEQWITHGKKNRPIDDGYGFFGPDDSFGENILRSKYDLPKCLSHSCRIKQDIKGRWFVYLHVDQHVINKIPTGCDVDHAVALDPGIRTFMTTYSCDGVVTEWAVNDSKRIHGLHLKADKLQSLIDCNKGKAKQLEKAISRIRYKIRNLVSDLHNRLALWLCMNYRIILIPIFDSKLKSLKKDRKINKVTVRMMYSFRHYDFRMRLKEVAERFAWCHVIETREPYTSKTCGNCGHLNDKLGSNKIFNCPSCAYCADRDANGARNILLRYLTIMGTNQDDE